MTTTALTGEGPSIKAVKSACQSRGVAVSMQDPSAHPTLCTGGEKAFLRAHRRAEAAGVEDVSS